MPVASTYQAQRMLIRLLQDALGGDVRVYAQREPPPAGDPDTGDDIPVTRWCRIANVVPGPMPVGGDAGEPHQVTLAVTVTVGVSNAADASDLSLIYADTDRVAAALNRVSDRVTDANDPPRDHTLQLNRAQGQVLSDPGLHDAHQIGVVTATGVLTAY